MKTQIGSCPKCGVNTKLTRHHIFPKRFFKPSKEILHICEICHRKLEFFIPQKQRMPNTFYVKIIDLFLNQRTPNTI